MPFYCLRVHSNGGQTGHILVIYVDAHGEIHIQYVVRNLYVPLSMRDMEILMIVIAMTLYLPQHITFLTNRAWFYYNGDESAKSALTSSSPVIVEAVKETIVKATANTGGKEL
ncbi:hypothetical protein ACMFMF_007332 [Clarireedia jacksonii]